MTNIIRDSKVLEFGTYTKVILTTRAEILRPNRSKVSQNEDQTNRVDLYLKELNFQQYIYEKYFVPETLPADCSCMEKF